MIFIYWLTLTNEKTVSFESFADPNAVSEALGAGTGMWIPQIKMIVNSRHVVAVEYEAKES